MTKRDAPKSANTNVQRRVGGGARPIMWTFLEGAHDEERAIAAYAELLRREVKNKPLPTPPQGEAEAAEQHREE